MSHLKSPPPQNWAFSYTSDLITSTHPHLPHDLEEKNIFTVRNEVVKVSFHRRVSVHSRGVPGPGEGCLVLGGLVPGRGVGIPACNEADAPPPERRLLLRTVRILLQCILVLL